MVEDHGAPEAGQLPRFWTRSLKSSSALSLSGRKVMNTVVRSKLKLIALRCSCEKHFTANSSLPAAEMHCARSAGNSEASLYAKCLSKIKQSLFCDQKI